MHRTDADGNVDNLFAEGDPAIPTAPTLVDSAVLNAWQEELAAIPESEGITLVKGTNNQVLTAITTKFSNFLGAVHTWPLGQTFSSLATFVTATFTGLATFAAATFNGAITSASKVLFTATNASSRTLVGEFTDPANPTGRRTLIYARGNTSAGGENLEFVQGATWDEGSALWTPITSGAICTKLKINHGLKFCQFTVSGTTTFTDATFEFAGVSSIFALDDTGATIYRTLTSTIPAGGNQVAMQVNADSGASPTHGHMGFSLMAHVPSAPAKGELYVDTSAILWICTNATGPVWTKVGTQT